MVPRWGIAFVMTSAHCATIARNLQAMLSGHTHWMDAAPAQGADHVLMHD